MAIDYHKLNRSAIYAVAFVVLAVVGLRQLWQTRSDLVQIKGTLASVNVSNEESRHGRSGTTTTSHLRFSLTEQPYLFDLVEQVDNYTVYEPHQHLSRSLQHAGLITVSINRSDIKDMHPAVQEILGDDQVLLSFDDQRNKDKLATVVSLILAIIAFALFVINIVPRFRKAAEEFLK